jgi:predicted  nucleic acid-binding Zn-ribbon protein
MILLNYKDWADNTHTKFKITKSFASLWMDENRLSLEIQGQSLSRVYENFVAQVSGIGEHKAGAMAEIVDLKKRIATMEAELQNLQKKMRKEPQYDKQVKMNKQVKAKRHELDELKEQLEQLK